MHQNAPPLIEDANFYGEFAKRSALNSKLNCFSLKFPSKTKINFFLRECGEERTFWFQSSIQFAKHFFPLLIFFSLFAQKSASFVSKKQLLFLDVDGLETAFVLMNLDLQLL